MGADRRRRRLHQVAVDGARRHHRYRQEEGGVAHQARRRRLEGAAHQARRRLEGAAQDHRVEVAKSSYATAAVSCAKIRQGRKQ